MTPLSQNKQSSQKRPNIKSDNFLESLRDLGGSVATGVTSDLLGGFANSAKDQIFGSTAEQTLQPNQTVDLSKIKDAQKPYTETYFQPFEKPLRKIESVVFTANQMEIEKQIQTLRQELKLLIKASSELAKEVDKTVEENPVQPGVYHLNFFRRLLVIIKIARQQVEESCTWLRLMQSKKKQKGYWAMFKKHGTTFGLSSERSLATSMG